MFRRGVAMLVAAAFVAAACSSSGSSSPPASTAPGASTAVTPIAGGLLEKVTKAGKLIVSTDANYAPQSVQKPDGTYEGFDIDVATEIAKRLGLTVEFVTPGWDIITAGSWSGRWDVSVGSMTITVPRQAVFEFSPPYYYTPAQMTATTASGITTIDGLAGKTVCVGSATTYEDWLKGQLQSVSTGTVATPPAGVKVQSLSTDQDCAQAIAAGRKDAEGYLTAGPTVDAGIKNGTPIIKIGDPVFTEQLAVAVDKSGPPTTDFMPALAKIIADMHADGTLKTLSEKWLGGDLTVAPS
jgi:polar amino acid transport system substrate-binding protein